MPHAVVYTRRNCCLCDTAKALLQSHGITVEEVDIDADTALHEKYNECVPVVMIDGKERFRGKIDETLLRRLLNSIAR